LELEIMSMTTDRS